MLSRIADTSDVKHTPAIDVQRRAAEGRPGERRDDVIAGLTAAAVVLPKAMAYATVAGLPVAVGLYTAFAPTAIYALLGSSRVLSVSSTTTLAILTASELAEVVPDDDLTKLARATATLVLLVGLALLAARLFRLGFVANFISLPVLAGFKAGIGVVILLDQLPKLLGLHIAKQSIFADAANLVARLAEASALSAGMGLATIASLTLLERWRPSAPAPLLTIAAAILTSWAFGHVGMTIATVGFIPQGLPSLTFPDASLARELLPGAIGIALMSFTESIAAAHAFAAPSDPPIEPNRELVATGVANLGGALIGAMPAGGGTSQTGMARAAGARSQRASLVTAATALATMVVLAPILGLLPQATLAAVVIFYSATLIQPSEFVAIYRVRRMEFQWALAAAAGVLVFGTLQGIVVAIVLSFVGLASQTAHPRVSVVSRKRGADVLRPLSPEHPDDETFGGLLILRPEGRLYFGNAQGVAEQVTALVREHQPRVLALDLSRVPDIEYSALQMLRTGVLRAGQAGQEVWLVGLNPGVLTVVRNSGFDEELGPDRLLFNARAAIANYTKRFDAKHAYAPASPP